MARHQYHRSSQTAHEKTCRCGNTYIVYLPGEEWKDKCIECWKLHKKRAESWYERHFGEQARRESEAKSQGPTGELEREFQHNLRALLMLCHPDKHNGSDLSNRVTQWLLKHKR